MKNCPVCSAPNEPGALRCQSCGERLSISLSGDTPQPRQESAVADDETRHGFGVRAKPTAKSTMLGLAPFASADSDSDIPAVFEPTAPRGPKGGGLEEPGRKRKARVDATMAPWANRDANADQPGGAMLPHGSTQFGVGRQDPKGGSQTRQGRGGDRGGDRTDFGTPVGSRKPLKPASSVRKEDAFPGLPPKDVGQQRRTAVGLPRLDENGEPSLEKTWVPGVTHDERPAESPKRPPSTMSVFSLKDRDAVDSGEAGDTWMGSALDEAPAAPMTMSIHGPAASQAPFLQTDAESADDDRDAEADRDGPPASPVTQAGIGAAVFHNSQKRTGSRPPVRKTLLGAPPVSVGEDSPEPPMTQAVGFQRFEPKRKRKPSAAKTQERAAPGSGLFKFPKRKGSSTPSQAPIREKRSTALGIPQISTDSASESASPGAYVFKKADISGSSQPVRISSSISARRLTPPSLRSLEQNPGKTQQISMPAVGELEEMARERARADAERSAPLEDAGVDVFPDDFLDSEFDDAIATLGGAAELIDAPGQVPESEDEGDKTDVQAFNPAAARAQLETGRTMQISVPAAAAELDDDDEFFGDDGDEDEEAPAATVQMILPTGPAAPKAGGPLAHADTSEIDLPEGLPEDPAEMAETASDFLPSPEVAAASAPDTEEDVPATAESGELDAIELTPQKAPAVVGVPESVASPEPAPATATGKSTQSAPRPPGQADPATGPTTAVAMRSAPPSETAVRMLGGAAGVAMLLGVVFQVLAVGTEQFGALTPVTQVSMAFPILGGLLMLGASALRFPVGMRALIIGLVGVIATMLIAATDLAPLASLGGLPRRAAMVVCFALPMALLWRGRYPQAFTSRIVVAAGILVVIANYAFLDFVLGDAGKPLALSLLDLAGSGAVGAIVAGLAAVPLLLVLPSLMAFRGSQSDGLGSVWAGLYLAWGLMMPVAAGAIAVQTTGTPGALLAFVGVGLSVFAAATAFSVGFAETFGRLTTLPDRQ